MDNIEQSGLGETETLSTEGTKRSWKLSRRTIIILVVALTVLALAYFYKGLFIVATVNGSPISRLSVIEKMEKTSGKQILDGLVTQKLVLGELDNRKIYATNEEVADELKKIEEQVTGQGNSLEQVLEMQGMNREELIEQISINLRVTKLFSEETQTSDDEVVKYIKDNKLTVPKGQETQFKDQVREQIKSGKLSETAKSWIETIRSQASINYFVTY